MFRQGSRVSSRSLKWFKSSQPEAGSGLFLKGYKSEKDLFCCTFTIYLKSSVNLGHVKCLAM